MGQGLLSAGPDRLYMGLEPTAELESVKLSLIEQQSQHLFPIHFTNPSIFKPAGLWRVSRKALEGTPRRSFSSVFYCSLTSNRREFPFVPWGLFSDGWTGFGVTAAFDLVKRSSRLFVGRDAS